MCFFISPEPNLSLFLCICFSVLYKKIFFTLQHMLVLEASTALKFSEHIIVHLPNSHLFPSCSSIKSYINLLEKEMNCSNRGLVFNADGTKKVTLCDTGVYTM